MDKYAGELYIAENIIVEGFLDKLAEEFEKDAWRNPISKFIENKAKQIGSRIGEEAYRVFSAKSKQEMQNKVLGATPQGKIIRSILLGSTLFGAGTRVGQKRKYESLAT